MSPKSLKKQKVRFFVLAFALSFFVLAMMGLVVVFVLNPVQEQSPSSQVSADSFYLPGEEDNLTVLLTCHDPQKGEAVSFALVRLDMLSGRIPVILFPLDTALEEQTGFGSLAQAYQTGGAPAAAKALSDTYSIPIDRYADGDTQSLIDAVNRIGIAEYELDQDLSYHENGMPVSLSAGRQLIDGQKFLDILRYPNYKGGQLEQCREGARLIASYINSRLDAVLGQNAESLVGGLLDLVDTNLSYLDYESRLPALIFLSKLSEEPAQAYTLTGGWNKAGVFIPDAPARRQLVQNFA